MEQTVYSRVETLNERCNLGSMHQVTYFLVKRIILAPEDFYDSGVDSLSYTRDGEGIIHVAYDAQGRRYERIPNRYGYAPWRRIWDDVIFTNGPTSRPAKDVYGRVIR